MAKMHILLVVMCTITISVVFAYPVERGKALDLRILKFANFLEQLESAFYTQALEKFDASCFLEAGFVTSDIPLQQIQTIVGDENIHASTLQSAIQELGDQVISGCRFNFSSALTSPSSVVAVAQAIENVGTSAYMGAVALLSDPKLVAAATGIMLVEARHQTVLNLLSDSAGVPQPFDVALTPEDVATIAGSFFSGCDAGFPANLPLTITNDGPLQAGTKLTFASPALNGTLSPNQLSCEIVTGVSDTFQPFDDCTVPANIGGPMYVFITKSSSETRTAVAGPTIAFVRKQDFIGDTIRPGFNAAMAGN